MSKDTRTEFEKGYSDNKLGRDYGSSSKSVKVNSGFVGIASSAKDDVNASEYRSGWNASKSDSGKK